MPVAGLTGQGHLCVYDKPEHVHNDFNNGYVNYVYNMYIDRCEHKYTKLCICLIILSLICHFLFLSLTTHTLASRMYDKNSVHY